jgi:uncharacterized membrane protein (TIGR02234 family)
MKIKYRSALMLLLLSSVVVVIIAGQTWAKVSYADPGFPVVSLTLSGRQLDPLLSGLGAASVAGVLGIVASRRILRRIFGAILILLGIGIIYSALSIKSGIHIQIEPLLADAVGRDVTNFEYTLNSLFWVAALAGLGVVVSGLLFLLSSYDASKMSNRYERHRDLDQELSPWVSLDLGIDPTLNGPSAESLD